MRDWLETLSGGEVLLSGPAVLWFATVAERAVGAQRLNGVRDPMADVWARALATAAVRVRTSAIGTSAVPIDLELPSCELLDPVSAQEAAEMFGVGDRNVTAQCNAGRYESARKVRGRWVIERSEVLRIVDERMAG